MTHFEARIESIAQKSNARAIGVALHDSETGVELHYEADRWFHGASTIKVAILLAVYGEIDSGRLVPQSRLHVRNRFLSAYDGSPFRVLADRDADSEVHAAIGKTMRVSELALHMIATSSNLATNLLLDLIGLDAVQRTIDRFGLTGLDVRRGVEDEKAFEHGIINRVTADGLVALLRLIAEERAYTPELSREMLDILHQQEFKKGIPGATCHARCESRTRPATSRRSRTTRASCMRRTQAVRDRDSHRVVADAGESFADDCDALARRVRAAAWSAAPMADIRTGLAAHRRRLSARQAASRRAGAGRCAARPRRSNACNFHATSTRSSRGMRRWSIELAPHFHMWEFIHTTCARRRRFASFRATCRAQSRSRPQCSSDFARRSASLCASPPTAAIARRSTS